MGVEKPDRRPRCGEDGTCCGSPSGCGDMDNPERSSIWWPIILVAFLAALVFIGSHRHAHAEPRDGNEARFRWEHNGESIGNPSSGVGKVAAICIRMKATDSLTLHGHRQRHPERFVECAFGHWPNVDSVFRKVD